MSKSKKNAKKAAAPAAKGATQDAKPIIRTIRVTQEILDAAKAYKKATGTSFYTLGFEAISDRLKREGYLKVAETAVGT